MDIADLTIPTVDGTMATVYEAIVIGSSPSVLMSSFKLGEYPNDDIGVDMKCDGTITYELNGKSYDSFGDVLEALENM
jgi:hypothetical protein